MAEGGGVKNRSRFFTRTKPPTVCECSCPEMAHWTSDRHCVSPGCGCTEFKAKKAANKYGAARTVINGQKFDSKFEGKVGTDLEYRRMCGEKFTVRRQVDFPLVVNGIKIATYRADYLVTHEDGKQEVVEPKGMETREFVMKWRLMEALHPEIRLTLEKQRGWRRR